MNVNKEIEDKTNSKKDGTFTFELKDAEGNVVDSKEITTQDLKGSVSFDKIDFDKAGTYSYTITEKNDQQAGFSYDEKEYKVTVDVIDDYENAKLSAKRARSVRNFIIAEGYDPSKIVVEEVGEDWDGLANFVRNSNLDGKDEILEILEDSASSPSQKKSKLRSLDKGRCWKQLCSGPMASLRRVVVQ